MLKTDQAVFVLVDVQEKLASVMADREQLIRNLQIVVAGMRALEIPILWMEQIPEKMGPTIPELRDLLEGETAMAKACFSCTGFPAFMTRLKLLNRKQVLIAGIEAHVCVYQTARDLLEQDFDVQVIADAVSSRTARNRDIGLARIRDDWGGEITSVECCLFELLQTAEHPAFKTILKLVK